MQRIMIIGGAGSGKSTLARALGERSGLPVFHLDALFWRPGWVESSRESFEPRLRELYREERWIIEGNYSGTWPERLAAADTLIFLDLPTPLRLWRITRRVLGSYGRVRPDMAPGCPEKFDWPFFLWAKNYARDHRPKAVALFQEAQTQAACHHLQSRKAVAAFLKGLDAEAG